MELTLNQKFNKVIESIDNSNKPNLFLHVCCAPCSCGVLYKLIQHFNIYIIFYNSNIDTFLEFNLRLYELKKMLYIKNYSLKIIYDDYCHSEFLEYVKGYENELEGGNRCKKCFELRLSKTYEIALRYIYNHKLESFTNFLCSTLSVSPHKNSNLIEQIGENICKDKILKYLPSDFKKEDGYLNSINISKELGLYRQKYCGCEFAK